MQQCHACHGTGECYTCSGHGSVPDKRDIRKLRPPGVSQEDMAHALEVSRSWIARLETGRAAMRREDYELCIDVLNTLRDTPEEEITE